MNISDEMDNDRENNASKGIKKHHLQTRQVFQARHIMPILQMRACVQLSDTEAHILFTSHVMSPPEHPNPCVLFALRGQEAESPSHLP